MRLSQACLAWFTCLCFDNDRIGRPELASGDKARTLPYISRRPELTVSFYMMHCFCFPILSLSYKETVSSTMTAIHCQRSSSLNTILNSNSLYLSCPQPQLHSDTVPNHVVSHLHHSHLLPSLILLSLITILNYQTSLTLALIADTLP